MDNIQVKQDNISFSFNLEDPFILEFIDKYSYEFADAIDAYTEESLKTVLQMGMEEGLGMPGIADLIQDVFTDMSDYRAETIARTETIRASNAASEMAYIQSGVVEGKQWLVTDDEITCDRCMPLNGIVVGLGENFFEGEDSDNPYNDVPYPPLHPRCRCTTITVLKKDYEDLFNEYDIGTTSINGLFSIFKVGSGNFGNTGWIWKVRRNKQTKGLSSIYKKRK